MDASDVPGKGWTEVKNLNVGDTFRNSLGETCSTLKNKILEPDPVPVYNFQVKEQHTYFVGTSQYNSILVHNAECDTIFGFETADSFKYGNSLYPVYIDRVYKPKTFYQEFFNLPPEFSHFEARWRPKNNGGYSVLGKVTAKNIIGERSYVLYEESDYNDWNIPKEVRDKIDAIRNGEYEHYGYRKDNSKNAVFVEKFYSKDRGYYYHLLLKFDTVFIKIGEAEPVDMIPQDKRPYRLRDESDESWWKISDNAKTWIKALRDGKLDHLTDKHTNIRHFLNRNHEFQTLSDDMIEHLSQLKDKSIVDDFNGKVEYEFLGEKWVLYSTDFSKYHIRKKAGDICFKWCSDSGRELVIHVIIDEKGDIISRKVETHLKYMGTFNYEKSMLGHLFVDVVPYYLYGN